VMTEPCDGCKWWSEVVVQVMMGDGEEVMEALCLNWKSPHHSRMVHDGCDKYEPGRAVDDPTRMTSG
jgi:hypothetical protein